MTLIVWHRSGHLNIDSALGRSGANVEKNKKEKKIKFNSEIETKSRTYS